MRGRGNKGADPTGDRLLPFFRSLARSVLRFLTYGADGVLDRAGQIARHRLNRCSERTGVGGWLVAGDLAFPHDGAALHCEAQWFR